MSRTSNRDHLSPTRSSVFATAQTDRRSGSGFFARVVVFMLVTCTSQVLMVAYRPHTCKVQVTRRYAMTNSASQAAALFGSGPRPMIGGTVKAALAVWLAIVVIAGASGAFVG